ncbi:MAG: amidohydrolase family protein [Myxococcaceae bacterium]
MEGRLLLKRCSIFRADGRVRDDMAVVVENGRITRIAQDAAVPVLPGDWEVDCRGRLVMPGLVDCHTHLVGGQLVPASGAYLLKSPRVRFELVNRLSAALTAGEVEALSAWGIARALRSGVSLAFEHLQAPGCVLAAMEAVGRTARRLGLRAVVSHATHSGPAPRPPLEQVEANAEFARASRSDALVRGAMGFYSSSTAEDELLRRVGRLREEVGVGAHFHLAESEDDLAATFSRYGRRVVQRLEPFGLLGAGSIGSHARAVDRIETDRLARTRTLVALSPKRAMTSEPGGGGLETVLSNPPLLGLGTAGEGTLWQELMTAFVTAVQLARSGRLLDPDGVLGQLLVSGPAELCSMLYSAPSGNVEEGCLADLVVYDHVPTLDGGTGGVSQMLMQLAEFPVAWTIVDGRVAVREGQLLGHELVELATEAARAAESVRARVGAPNDVA